MVRYSKQQSPSQETQDEAMKIARAHQRPGQSKEQTKLIAQGIQKGIAEYKKQQKAKARDADRQRKRETREHNDLSDEPHDASPGRHNNPLPWILLAVSWGLFGAYLLFRPF